MATIPIELPDELRAFVESHVQQGNFASANDYIVALVAAARQQRTSLDAVLSDGLASGPAEEWTAAEWDGIRQRITSRHSTG